MDQRQQQEAGSGKGPFSEFYEKWMAQLEDILHQLIKLLNSNNHQNGDDLGNNDQDQQMESLVTKVTMHQKQYYAAKWAAANDDVLAFFAPTWLSPLEIAHSWVTGWKPSMAFRVIDLLKKQSWNEWEGSEEKTKKIRELRVRIKMEEDKVEREIERQQVAMGDRRMVELARLTSRGEQQTDEEVKRVEELVEVAMKGLKSGLEKVLKAADCVRLKTLKGVLDILTPRSRQCVEFLAAAFLRQIQIRKRGGSDKDEIHTHCGRGGDRSNTF